MKKNKKEFEKMLRVKIVGMEEDVSKSKEKIAYVEVYKGLYTIMDAINYVEKSIPLLFEKLDKIKIEKVNLLDEF